MDGPILVLGATSQIARDFVINAHRTCGVEFALFARRPEVVRAHLQANGLPLDWAVGDFDELPKMGDGIRAACGIINFVGVGDPAKAREIGAGIFTTTLESDALARRFLATSPETPYIFLSSGAVYGAGFSVPANATTPCVVPVNQLEPQHYYTISKLHAEAMHRAFFGATILDLRIFNYFSRTTDIGARFLITDMVRCVVEDAVFETTEAPITRDYVHPEDLSSLIMALLAVPKGTNTPIDAYSAAPITKAELIDLFQKELGLKVRIEAQSETVNATGSKPEYYSHNRSAQSFGYSPRFSSAEGVLIEARAMIDRLRHT